MRGQIRQLGEGLGAAEMREREPAVYHAALLFEMALKKRYSSEETAFYQSALPRELFGLVLDEEEERFLAKSLVLALDAYGANVSVFWALSKTRAMEPRIAAVLNAVAGRYGSLDADSLHQVMLLMVQVCEGEQANQVLARLVELEVGRWLDRNPASNDSRILRLRERLEGLGLSK